MSRIMLMLFVAHLCCLLLASRADCQQPADDATDQARKSRLQLIEAETELKMQELELAMSERAEEEAQLDVEKAKLQVVAAEKSREAAERVAFAKLEMRQAQIRLEMQRVRSEMARLRIKQAKAHLDFSQAALSKQPVKRTQVHLEYVDDLDVVIIRGAKKDVDKVRALIENAEKQRQPRE